MAEQANHESNSMELGKTLKTFWYSLRLTAKLAPGLLAMELLRSVCKAALPFVAIALPKLVLDGVTNGMPTGQLLLLAFGAAALGALLLLAGNLLSLKLDREDWRIDKLFDKALGDKTMAMDFPYLEDPEILKLLSQAKFGRNTSGGIGGILSWHLPAVLTALFTCVGMLWIITALDWWVLASIVVTVGMILLIQLRGNVAQNKFAMRMGEINRKFMYYYMLCQDFSAGKDLRLFGGAPMVYQRIHDFQDDMIKEEMGVYKVMTGCGVQTAILSQLQMGVIYAALLAQVFTRGLSVGDFILYTGAAVSFTTALLSLVKGTMFIMLSARMINPFRDFMHLENRIDAGKTAVAAQTMPVIRFEDVTFTYPRAKTPTLKNLNLTIEPGKRLAVVGLNGAGKTTMIKLLLGLYRPDHGRITLGGQDVASLDAAQYRALFSVVFQDFKLCALTVKENVAMGEVDENRLQDALTRAGLADTLAKLPAGADTSVYKLFDDKGVDFSGGEKQKLAIARALYKNSPMVVMDEPTAALDPVAEAEIYSRLNDLVKDKTALFISHRLSSCKFCDEVAVFEDGAVVERGSHETLMQANGLYARMFEAQAQYYVA